MADDSEVIAKAAPYITAALTQPMDQLFTKAEAGKADDALNFGLALFASRPSRLALSDDQMAHFAEMEPRIGKAAETYLAKNPKAQMTLKKWQRVLKVTPEDMAVVDRYQKIFMADYWLARARDEGKVSGQSTLQRPTPYRPTGPISQAGDTALRISKTPTINRGVFITATHCVQAVRQAVGGVHYRPSKLQVSIQLLWSYAPYDSEGWIEKNFADGKVIAGGYNIPLGAAACGTSEQFDAYVVMLESKL